MKPISLEKLGEMLGAPPQGDPQTVVSGVSSLDFCRPGTLVMVESKDQLDALSGTEVAAVLCKTGVETDRPGFCCDEPRILFAGVLEYFHPEPQFQPGVHESATVDHRAEVDESAYVGPFCTVGPNVKIGP